MAKPFNPVSTFLIVEPGKVEEKSEGGIIIPENARATLHDGVILKVGPRCSARYKPGDKIVFSKSSEYKLKVDKEVIFVVEECNILLHDGVEPVPKPVV